MTAVGKFEFGPFDEVVGEDIVLVVWKRTAADPDRGHVPAYHCDVLRAIDRVRVGNIAVRIGDDPWVWTFAGHVGYTVEPQHRGHGYAHRACVGIAPILRHHGLVEIWITVSPDNVPSRRTCRKLGATLVEVVHLPPDCDMYREGQRRKCRYRWVLD